MSGNEAPQLLGLASASIVGAFTTSPSVISLIYDAMTVEWNNGGPAPAHMPTTGFSILASPAARGRTVRLTLRGFGTPPGAGAVDLEVAGAPAEIRPTEENYEATVTAILSAEADTTPVKVTLNLPQPADQSAAMLGLDSIDISLADCPGRQAA